MLTGSPQRPSENLPSPAGCHLPGHRVLGAAEGFDEITDFELALYYRDEAPASTTILAERLVAYCHLEE